MQQIYAMEAQKLLVQTLSSLFIIIFSWAFSIYFYLIISVQVFWPYISFLVSMDFLLFHTISSYHSNSLCVSVVQYVAFLKHCLIFNFSLYKSIWYLGWKLNPYVLRNFKSCQHFLFASSRFCINLWGHVKSIHLFLVECIIGIILLVVFFFNIVNLCN